MVEEGRFCDMKTPYGYRLEKRRLCINIELFQPFLSVLSIVRDVRERIFDPDSVVEVHWLLPVRFAESTNAASPGSMPEKLSGMLFMRGASRQKRRRLSVQQASFDALLKVIADEATD